MNVAKYYKKMYSYQTKNMCIVDAEMLKIVDFCQLDKNIQHLKQTFDFDHTCQKQQPHL